MDAALDLDGRKASDISDSIEASIREGQLAAGAQLPTVRSLADQLQVSPSTVSAAYRHLRQRGVISTHGRGGTRVHSRPPVEVAKPFRLDAGLRDLRGLVPASELGQILREVVQELAEHRQMDEEDEFELENRLAKDLSADGINIDHVLAVGSAREGLSRVLESHLLPGDRVAIEAPSSGPVTEVLSLNGLDAVPVEMDRQGATAVSLAATLNGVDAVILTPRAQDPTGAVMTSQRASEIRVELRRRPDVLLVEWDPQGPLAGTDYEPVADPDRSHWATIRSYDDTFAGQLTLAAVAGDPVTLARVRGRQLLSGSGLPPLVRRLVANVLAHPGTPRRAEGQARQNGSRRVVLLAALRNRGIVGDGQSGPYIWVPTRDQAGTVDAMKAKGWLVGDAKRPTTTSPQGIRVSVADLDATSAARFADDLLEVLAEL